MKKIVIKKVIEELSQQRPIFHSEKDFQFSLAWKIKSLYPEIEIRLEKPLRKNSEETKHLHILLKEGSGDIGLEMKFITARLLARFRDEVF